jgi:hypothetical protein
VQHYKHFFGYFKQYNEAEHLGRLAIFRALMRRILEVRNDDEKIAMRHVLAALYPDSFLDPAFGEERIRRAGSRVVRDMPFEMSAKMLLRPLDLPDPIQRGLVYAAPKIARPVSRYLYAH